MNKIKKGDQVVVITGKDKGKKGKILAVLAGGLKVLVEGINVAKKHVKPNPNMNQSGGILDKEMPLHRSNVMLYDVNVDKPSRVGIRTLEDGKQKRYFKSSDQLIDVKK